MPLVTKGFYIDSGEELPYEVEQPTSKILYFISVDFNRLHIRAC